MMIDLGVDHIGSVLMSADNWRDAQLKQTVDAIQRAGRKSSLIPLFQDVDLVCRAIDYYGPDIIHFCETLPVNAGQTEALMRIVERQRAIRRAFPKVAIMRSIPIAVSGWADIQQTLSLATVFEPVSDWFLTDTLLVSDADACDDAQPVNGFVGITGRTCDWSVARELVRHSRIPMILAGGIGPSNVRAAIEAVGPAGVDSCTLTNAVDPTGKSIRFKKDKEKVKAMIDLARGCH